MRLKAEAFGEPFDAHDIYEIFYTRTGFRVLLTGFKAGTKDFAFMEVFFTDVRGFRCLDEGDLIAYWESEQFGRSHCLYKITDGGWLENEVKGMLSVSGASPEYVEYLITSEDYCACILSDEQPQMRIYDDPYPLQPSRE